MSKKVQLEQQIKELTLELEELNKQERKIRVSALKDKFDKGEHILVLNKSNPNNINRKSKKWVIEENFDINEFIENKDLIFKFIHKKDEDILKAYLSDDLVKIQYKDKFSEEFKNMGLDFVSTYNEKNIYKFKDLEWYEKESNIGKAIIDNKGFVKVFTEMDFNKGYTYHSNNYTTSPLSYWKPATKEDLFKLLMEDKNDYDYSI